MQILESRGEHPLQRGKLKSFIVHGINERSGIYEEYTFEVTNEKADGFKIGGWISKQRADASGNLFEIPLDDPYLDELNKQVPQP